MNSAKFRIQSAYANPGTRPAFKIAQEQAKLRYMSAAAFIRQNFIKILSKF